MWAVEEKAENEAEQAMTSHQTFLGESGTEGNVT